LTFSYQLFKVKKPKKASVAEPADLAAFAEGGKIWRPRTTPPEAGKLKIT